MRFLFISVLFVGISACSPDIEEIKDPNTGTVLMRYEYYTDDNGQKVKNGQYTKWNPDGSLSRQCIYADGKKEGEEIVYVTQDSIVYNNYVNDSLDGTCRIECNGTLRRKLTYKNGSLDGRQQYFYPDGTLRTQGLIKNGFNSGPWKCYTENGKLCATFTFADVPCYITELEGRWNRQTDFGKETYYIFDNLGTAAYYAPLFKYDKKAAPFAQYEGFVFLNEQLVISTGQGVVEYDVISFDGKELKVRNRFGETVVYEKASK